MGRRSPSTCPSLVKRKRKQNLTLLKRKLITNKSSCREDESKIQGGKTRSSVGDSQGSQERWTEADRKETRWRYVTKSFHEAGLQINDKETLMAIESQGRSEKRRRTGKTVCRSFDRNQQEIEEEKKSLKTASTLGFSVVKWPTLPRNRKVLWRKSSSNALQGTKQHGSFVEKKDRSGRRKKRGSCPRAATQSVNFWTENIKVLLDLIKEHGWDKDKEEMISLSAACSRGP